MQSEIRRNCDMLFFLRQSNISAHISYRGYLETYFYDWVSYLWNAILPNLANPVWMPDVPTLLMLFRWSCVQRAFTINKSERVTHEPIIIGKVLLHGCRFGKGFWIIDELVAKGVNLGEDVIIWSPGKPMGLEGKDNLCLGYSETCMARTREKAPC